MVWRKLANIQTETKNFKPQHHNLPPTKTQTPQHWTARLNQQLATEIFPDLFWTAQLPWQDTGSSSTCTCPYTGKTLVTDASLDTRYYPNYPRGQQGGNGRVYPQPVMSTSMAEVFLAQTPGHNCHEASWYQNSLNIYTLIWISILLPSTVLYIYNPPYVLSHCNN